MKYGTKELNSSTNFFQTKTLTYLCLSKSKLKHLQRFLEYGGFFFNKIRVSIFFFDGFHGGQQRVEDLVVLIFQGVQPLHHCLGAAQDLVLRQRRHLADLLNLLSAIQKKLILAQNQFENIRYYYWNIWHIHCTNKIHIDVHIAWKDIW